MKTYSIFTKTVVFLVFILLVAGFVAYRSGAFDKMVTSKKGRAFAEMEDRTATSNQSDTIPKADSVPVPPTIMSGSKSITISDNYKYVIKNGKPVKKLNTKAVKRSDSLVKEPVIIFSGSKSGIMIPSRTTLRPDTAKKNQ